MTEDEIQARLEALRAESRALHDAMDALVRERVFQETGFRPGDRVLTWSFKTGDGPMYVIGVRYVVADARGGGSDGDPPKLVFASPPGAEGLWYADCANCARTVEELNGILAARFPGKNVRAAYVVDGTGEGGSWR